MSKIFSGKNPSQLYMNALITLINEGDECAPRGKNIKEIRPVIFEYQNPTSRVTFLKGRKINPFFQLAESLWIISGRSDVEWLLDYNKNMGQFSDDGIFFNAPYGERLRYWNKSDANRYIYNPLDQLLDVYKKIQADNDTRQAVAVIYNPIFDHADKKTLDTPCNLILTFKLRHGKLDLNVFNRSNDLHWGTFGANLCQFATIQEVVASWLGVEIGTYYQTTDSLHIYLDEYGAKETDKITNAYSIYWEDNGAKFFDVPVVKEFLFPNEPRFNSNFDQFEKELNYYFTVIDPMIRSEQTYKIPELTNSLLNEIKIVPDSYLKMTYTAMVAYQAHKRGHTEVMIRALSEMNDCSWKVSCLRFISNKYKDIPEFQLLYKHLADDIKDYIECKGE